MDKKGYDFVLEKDVRSSVPRLTLSLNKGYWGDENKDSTSSCKINEIIGSFSWFYGRYVSKGLEV